MTDIANNDDLLDDSVRAVFNCGVTFNEARKITALDEFNPQQTLSTQRTNFRHIYENKLPHEIGQSLAIAPEYDDTSRLALISHFKELVLEDLIEQQDYQNRYVQEDVENNNDNDNDNDNDSSMNYTPTPSPSPFR